VGYAGIVAARRRGDPLVDRLTRDVSRTRDILGILRVPGPEVDTAYVTQWAGRLGLAGIWDAILARAGAK
jgi:hypothetical protein